MKLQEFNELLEKDDQFLIEQIVHALEGVGDDPAAKHKISKQLTETLTGKESLHRCASGFKLIWEDIKGHLPPYEFKQVEQECATALTKLSAMSGKKMESLPQMMDKMEKMPDTFQELLGISDQTLEHFYQAGMRHYAAAHYADAGTIFFTLSVLSPFRFNIWQALGLSEEKLLKHEKALEAFAMATIMDPSSPIPHMHSGACYLAIHDKIHAKATLKHALELIDKQNPSVFEKEKKWIADMLLKSA